MWMFFFVQDFLFCTTVTVLRRISAEWSQKNVWHALGTPKREPFSGNATQNADRSSENAWLAWVVNALGNPKRRPSSGKATQNVDRSSENAWLAWLANWLGEFLFCTTVCIFGRISDGRFVFCVPPPFSKSIFCATVAISHPDCTPL